MMGMTIELTEEEVLSLRDFYDKAYLNPVYWDLFVNKAITMLREKGVLEDD